MISWMQLVTTGINLHDGISSSAYDPVTASDAREHSNFAPPQFVHSLC